MEHEHNELLDLLATCADACDNCVAACLHEKDVHALVNCIRLDRDCADICRLTASYIARDSTQAGFLIHACGEICLACAAECSKHAHMEHCRECAEACRNCADACSVGVG